MIITWKFPINKSELTQDELEQLTFLIKNGIGFNSEEISVQENKILASPEFGRRIFRVQTFRMALYDLVVFKEEGNMVFRFRFLTLYSIPAITAIIFGIVSRSINIGTLFFCVASILIMSFKWIENIIQKSKLTSEVKQILD